MKGMTIIVKKITQLVAPIIFLFGFYIVIHGHLSPGGGFAGGVIMAGAIILQILANGNVLNNLLREEHSMELLESVAIFLFMLIAVLGLLVSGTAIFFQNFVNKGVLGNLLSAGFIPIENIVVGAEVFAAISTIFIAMVIYNDEVKK